MIFIFVLYFLIGFLASTIGAMAGLGGGIIIKPLLDFLGHYDLATIGVLSAATVFSMSAVSLMKLRNSSIKIHRGNSILIAMGSIIGGFIGKAIFNYLVVNNGLDASIGVFQSSLLAFILILIFIFIKFNEHMKTFQVTSSSVIILVGLFLGILSSFLGIGGGPLNVAILVLLFSMDAKHAGVNSIFIIFFSQLSSLLLVAFTSGFGGLDLTMLWFMVAGGILGGFIGVSIVRRLTNKKMEVIFNATILVVIFINVYNIAKMFL